MTRVALGLSVSCSVRGRTAPRTVIREQFSQICWEGLAHAPVLSALDRFKGHIEIVVDINCRIRVARTPVER